MSYRNILVPVTDVHGAEIALKAAMPLAAKWNGKITALHVRFDPEMPLPYVAGPVPTEMLVELTDNAEKIARARADELRQHVASLSKDAPVTWCEDVGSVDFRYGMAGRVHDVAVIPKPALDNSGRLADLLEGLLFHSGRPVLMVPEKPFSASSVVVAWNGSMEAARAVAAAMPFLEAAKRVAIVTIGDDCDGPSPQTLARSLQNHDIQADVIETSEDGVSDGTALLNVSAKLNADLVVMGAYSHSRLRQLILGGVTRDIIEKSEVSVLLVH